MKLVIDTNVIIAGLYSRSGASFKIIKATISKKLNYSISPLIVLEYIGKIEDKKLDGLLELPLNDYLAIIKVFVENGHQIYEPVLNRPTLSDTSDDKILECAIAGQCDVITAFNKRDFPVDILKQFHLQALTPGEVIRHGGIK